MKSFRLRRSHFPYIYIKYISTNISEIENFRLRTDWLFLRLFVYNQYIVYKKYFASVVISILAVFITFTKMSSVPG